MEETCDVFSYFYLLDVLFRTVAVRAINLGASHVSSEIGELYRMAYHDLWLESRFDELLAAVTNKLSLVVWPACPPSENNVDIRVPL